MKRIERPPVDDSDLSEALREKEAEIQRQHRALAAFRSTTNEQAAMIEQLKAEIASYRENDRNRSETREQAREIALLRRQIAEYERNVEERGRLIEEFRRKAVFFEAETKQLRIVAGERLATIEFMDEELKRRQEAIDVTTRAATERLATLEASAEMQRLLGSRVQSLQAMLASREAQLAAKERELATLRAATLGRARLSNAAIEANRRVSDEVAEFLEGARRRIFRSGKV